MSNAQALHCPGLVARLCANSQKSRQKPRPCDTLCCVHTCNKNESTSPERSYAKWRKQLISPVFPRLFIHTLFFQRCFSVTNKQLFELNYLRIAALQLICCHDAPASLTGFVISQMSSDSKLCNLYKEYVLRFVFSICSELYIKMMSYKSLCCLQVLR